MMMTFNRSIYYNFKRKDMVEEVKKNMVYRYLGNSGLRVSVLGFGNWINSDT